MHINQDTLKSREKCVQATLEAVKRGQSVVVDNTNPDVAVRALYVKIGREFSVPVRCFWFHIPEGLAHHLNAYRETITKVRGWCGNKCPSCSFSGPEYIFDL